MTFRAPLVLLAAVALLTAAPATHAVQPGAMATHDPMRQQRQRPDGSVDSPNWSGYAVTAPAGSITGVTGSWVVPVATCSGTAPQASGASHWVGIDGYTSRTVEQTGTDADCVKGQPRYYAWYEFYPLPGITIRSLTVHAGDVMQASVTYADGLFTAAITDVTTGESFSTSAAVSAAHRNSAEWIAEDNATRFTDFGTASFGQDLTGVPVTCAASTSAGTGLQPIGAFPARQVHAITMVDSAGTTMAVTGPLFPDGTSFQVQWLSAK
jgi:hypothetical protein